MLRLTVLGSYNPNAAKQDLTEEPSEVASDCEKFSRFVPCVCPACKTVVELPDNQNMGQIIKCPVCNQKVVVDRM